MLEVASVDPDANDHLLGSGASARALAALRDARASGASVWVRTVVTRSNDRLLHALPRWLADHGASAWLLALARTDDVALAARTVPSLGIATPHALRAASAAAELGIEPFLEGFPLYVLGPFARWSVGRTVRLVPEGDLAPPCTACPARPRCEGLSAAHRARFGARELHPVAPQALLAGATRETMARALVPVGPG